MKLAYHQWRGRLGQGDLHPGGEAATRKALEWLGPPGDREILEIGAGIGLSSRRLRDAGWHVSALEPDPVLGGILGKIPGIRVLPVRLDALGTDDAGPRERGAYHAALAESVLYALDLPRTFARIHDLLRDRGELVFCDMVWTHRVSPAEAARLHDETLDRFGIACASREPWTWSDWRRMLGDAGFEIVHEDRLGAGSPGSFSRVARPGLTTLLATLPDRLRHRFAARKLRTPEGLLESWMCHARRR